jgi:hypothetical protein
MKKVIYIKKSKYTGNCPKCNAVLSGSTGPNREMEEGDNTICLYCHSILKVAYIEKDSIYFKIMDESELLQIKAEEPAVYSNLMETLEIVKSINIKK